MQISNLCIHLSVHPATNQGTCGMFFSSLSFRMFYLGAFRLIFDQIRAELNWIIYEHTAGETDLNGWPQSSEWREILIFRLNLLPTGFRLVRDLYLSPLKPISFTPSQVAGLVMCVRARRCGTQSDCKQKHKPLY